MTPVLHSPENAVRPTLVPRAVCTYLPSSDDTEILQYLHPPIPRGLDRCWRRRGGSGGRSDGNDESGNRINRRFRSRTFGSFCVTEDQTCDRQSRRQPHVHPSGQPVRVGEGPISTKCFKSWTVKGAMGLDVKISPVNFRLGHEVWQKQAERYHLACVEVEDMESDDTPVTRGHGQ